MRATWPWPDRARSSRSRSGRNARPVGSVGYWEKPAWLGDTVWETGWSVLPEFQGQGIATRATVLVVARAAAEGLHRSIHAFPSVDNGPSNAVCRKAGFTLLGAHDFEYLPGLTLHCNDWAFELPAPAAAPRSWRDSAVEPARTSLSPRRPRGPRRRRPTP